MKILDFLFGWTGYEPLSFLLSGLNIIGNISFCLLLEYIPLRKFLRVKPRTAILLNAGLIVLCAAFYLCFPSLINESGKGQIFGLALYFALFMPLALFLLKGCFFQNLFIIAFSQCATQFILGAGNWLEFRFGELFFPDVYYEVALIAKLILCPLFLLFCTYILRKLFTAWNEELQTQLFWKVLWIIPVTLCVLTAISGTVYNLTENNSLSFLLSRIFGITALFVCIIMMTDIMNRERETAADKLKAELMNTAEEAYEKSRSETLSTLQAISCEKKTAARAIEDIIKYSKQSRYKEISDILKKHLAVIDKFSNERVCENEAVNALVTYYSSIAKKEGIEVTLKLSLPRTPGRIAAIDLSRIVGNMLENAIEACRLMEYGTKSIKLHSMITGDTLVLGMHNSFDGDYQMQPDGGFISRKRSSGIATGLNSIRSVAEKYDGSVKFEAADRIFKTSVKLDMAAGKPVPRQG
ncbi:MAG: GHKL domain-containing protein [Ruminococcus sp.]|jgi:signal transduction histidine kinase|nr:GHKL domain-containing protein [Ruminococcus sp.]